MKRLMGLLLGCLSLSAWSEVPLPGMAAPAVVLPDQAGKVRRLEEWRGRWVVLYFYPKDDTPGCTTEAKAFGGAADRLSGFNAQVVGVSLDDVASHRAFAAKYGITFPLLADVGGAVAKRYGALFNLGALQFAKRQTFLINPEGKIARRYEEVDASRHTEEVVADLRELAGRR